MSKSPYGFFVRVLRRQLRVDRFYVIARSSEIRRHLEYVANVQQLSETRPVVFLLLIWRQSQVPLDTGPLAGPSCRFGVEFVLQHE